MLLCFCLHRYYLIKFRASFFPKHEIHVGCANAERIVEEMKILELGFSDTYLVIGVQVFAVHAYYVIDQ